MPKKSDKANGANQSVPVVNGSKIKADVRRHFTFLLEDNSIIYHYLINDPDGLEYGKGWGLLNDYTNAIVDSVLTPTDEGVHQKVATAKKALLDMRKDPDMPSELFEEELEKVAEYTATFARSKSTQPTAVVGGRS